MYLFPCPLSRIVLRGQEIVNSVVPNSNGVFDFQKTYQLSEEEVRLPPGLSGPPAWKCGRDALESKDLEFYDLKACQNSPGAGPRATLINSP